MSTVISPVVAIYNGLPLVLDCLRSLYEDISPDIELTPIVVDDGSTDKSADEILRLFPTTRVIQGTGQLWWTGAMKLGTQYAFDHGADYVLWLNHDDIWQAGNFATLLSTEPEVRGILACGVKFSRESAVFLGYTLRFSRWYIEPIIAPPLNLSARPFDLNGGHGIFFAKATWAKYSRCLRPHLFPHYCGDFDFFLQLKSKHAPVVSTPRAIVINKPETSGLLCGKKIARLGQVPSYLFSKKSMGNLRDRPLMALLNFPPILNILWALVFVLASFYACVFYKIRK